MIVLVKRGDRRLEADAYTEMESLLQRKSAEHDTGSDEGLAFAVQKTSVPKR